MSIIAPLLRLTSPALARVEYSYGPHSSGGTVQDNGDNCTGEDSKHTPGGAAGGGGEADRGGGEADSRGGNGGVLKEAAAEQAPTQLASTKSSKHTQGTSEARVLNIRDQFALSASPHTGGTHT